MEYFILRERLNLCTEKRKRAESAAGWGAAGSAISIWLRHSTSVLHPPAATLRQAASSPEHPVCTPLPASVSTGPARRATGSLGGARDQLRLPRTAWQPHTSPLPCCWAPSKLNAPWHRWAAFLPPSLVILGTARRGWQEVSRRGRHAHRTVPGHRDPDLILGTALGRQRRPQPVSPWRALLPNACLHRDGCPLQSRACAPMDTTLASSMGLRWLRSHVKRQRGHSLLTCMQLHTRAHEEQACEDWPPPL